MMKTIMKIIMKTLQKKLFNVLYIKARKTILSRVDIKLQDYYYYNLCYLLIFEIRQYLLSFVLESPLCCKIITSVNEFLENSYLYRSHGVISFEKSQIINNIFKDITLKKLIFDPKFFLNKHKDFTNSILNIENIFKCMKKVSNKYKDIILLLGLILCLVSKLGIEHPILYSLNHLYILSCIMCIFILMVNKYIIGNKVILISKYPIIYKILLWFSYIILSILTTLIVHNIFELFSILKKKVKEWLVMIKNSDLRNGKYTSGTREWPKKPRPPEGPEKLQFKGDPNCKRKIEKNWLNPRDSVYRDVNNVNEVVERPCPYTIQRACPSNGEELMNNGTIPCLIERSRKDGNSSTNYKSITTISIPSCHKGGLSFFEACSKENPNELVLNSEAFIYHLLHTHGIDGVLNRLQWTSSERRSGQVFSYITSTDASFSEYLKDTELKTRKIDPGVKEFLILKATNTPTGKILQYSLLKNGMIKEKILDEYEKTKLKDW